MKSTLSLYEEFFLFLIEKYEVGIDFFQNIISESKFQVMLRKCKINIRIVTI